MPSQNLLPGFQEKTNHAMNNVQPFKTQLLKWIGNKQRFAHEIISYFPESFDTFIEPFVGSGAIVGTLAPEKAIASDILKPLIEIWQMLSGNPEILKQWYRVRWMQLAGGNKKTEYRAIRASFNQNPNGADLLFLSRSCYGGVIRFRKADGYMSTPCGAHDPISPESFSRRVDIWHERTKHVQFFYSDFESIMDQAKPGDMIYCDPPYDDTQSILYGSQSFRLERLIETIARCKSRGVYVALSIDGTKKAGKKEIQLPIPDDLFEHEAFVNCGQSMLRRFQMEGQTLEDELVTDRLLMTY